MAEVKYGDEKLLTSDEFIKAAKENADKNFQVQKETAQKVWDATYGALDEQYAAAETAAGNAKQRNLINADTEYQRQELKYGAEQEALAASGLLGSGMNEYRRAQAYQQKREDTQASYADYDKAMREAAYARDQGKLTADLNKAQTEANAEIQYNDTLTNLAEKELNYDTLEKQAIDSSYGTYIAGINDGSMTLDQIKADSYWSKLSQPQKSAVERAWSVKQLKNAVDSGDDFEKIEQSYAYLNLDAEGRQNVRLYYDQARAAKVSDANAALESYINMAANGVSVDTIKTIAEANGHYAALNESGSWSAVIKESPYSPENEQYKANIESFAQELKNYGSLNDVENYLKLEAVPESERAAIIAKWQEGNAQDAINEISNGDVEVEKSQYGVDLPVMKVNGRAISAEDIVYGIDKGMFGDKTKEVANAYADAMIKFISDGSVTADMGGRAYHEAKELENHMDPEKWNALESAYDDLGKRRSGAITTKTAEFKGGLTYKIDDEEVKIEQAQVDKKTIAILNDQYPDSYLIYVKYNGNGYIALGGGRWGKVAK